MRLKPAFVTKLFFDDLGYLCIEQGGGFAVQLSPEQTKNLREFIAGSYFHQQNLWRISNEEEEKQ